MRGRGAWRIAGGLLALSLSVTTAAGLAIAQGEPTPPAPPASTTPVETLPLPPTMTPALSGAEGISPTPTPRPTPSAESVEIDNWAFQTTSAGLATIYFRESVSPDALLRGWDAVDLALVRVPEALGAPTASPVDVYLFGSREELHRALAEYARTPRGTIYPGLRALSRTSEPHAGIYHDTSYFLSAFMATRIVAHEYAHQIVRRLAGSNPLPQWFNEAVAETVGARVAADRDPEFAERRNFTMSAQVANAYGVGALQGLTSLVSSSQWSNAAAATDVTYALGWVAGERLAQARGLGSFGATLSLMGSGLPFSDAFRAVYDQSPEAFEAELQDYLVELLTQYPAGISVQRDSSLLGEFVQFAVVGLEPAEALLREYSGPRGCRASGRGFADALGFHEFRFRAEPSAGCAGAWTVTVTGDQGSQSSALFVLAMP